MALVHSPRKEGGCGEEWAGGQAGVSAAQFVARFFFFLFSLFS